MVQSIAAEALISALTIVPSAIFADVIVPSAISPATIVPSAIMADVTPPVAISIVPGTDSVSPEPADTALAALNAA